MSSLRYLIIFDNGIENGRKGGFRIAASDKENWPYISRTVIRNSRALFSLKRPNDNICTKKKTVTST